MFNAVIERITLWCREIDDWVLRLVHRQDTVYLPTSKRKLLERTCNDSPFHGHGGYKCIGKSLASYNGITRLLVKVERNSQTVPLWEDCCQARLCSNCVGIFWMPCSPISPCPKNDFRLFDIFAVDRQF